MNEIKEISIKIIDVLDNDRFLIEEKTEIQNPTFIVNGSDDKFVSLMTTELHFNLLVSENVEAIFFHLFTGSETRYKVVFEDVTDEENPVIVWSGFLLPEQFTEPYKYASFFVSFVATDGIGRLKNVELNAFYYSEKKSVLEVINQCLLQTGLQLPLLFAPAIQNAGFSLNYEDLEVDTSSYVENGKRLSAYDILQKVIISIGCRFFQYQNQWVIVGLNRINDTVILFKKYEVDATLSLNYEGEVLISRTILNKKFLAHPSISIISPLKKMVTNWNANNSEDLIPEDVINHYPVNIDTDITDRTLKYWKSNFSKEVNTEVYLGFLTALQTVGGSVTQYLAAYNLYYQDKSTLANIIKGPFYTIFYDGSDTFVTTPVVITKADLAVNYSSLLDSFFITASTDENRYGSLTIAFETIAAVKKPDEAALTAYFDLKGSFTSIVNNGVGKARIVSNNHGLVTGNYIEIPVENNTLPTYYNGVFKVVKVNANTFDLDINYTETFAGDWVIKPFKENFYFAVTRKDYLTQPDASADFFISNFDEENAVNGLFDFNITKENEVVSGILTIDKILFTKAGYYNIRLYPVVSHSLLTSRIVFTQLSFTLKTDSDVQLEQVRNLNFTTSNEIDIFHSASQMKLSNRSFLFSEALNTQASLGTLVAVELQVTPLFYTNTPVLDNGVLWYTSILVGLDDVAFNKIQNGYQIFVQKYGTTTKVALTANTFVVYDNAADGGKVLSQIKFDGLFGSEIYIEENDTIFLKINTDSTNTIDYADYWLNRWQRFGVNESISFIEAITAIYHGCLYDYNLKITGSYTAFLTPFDLVDFKYKGVRRYTPVKMDLNLTEGITNVTLVESKYTSVPLENADAVEEVVVVLDDVAVVPAIYIESVGVAPSWFIYSWTIQTNYTFTGFSFANAVLTAKQFTDSTVNGGVVTGLQKTAAITTLNGVQVFNFPILIGAEGGWWQLQILQDGVLSNVTEVQVAPVVLAPTERIEIATIYIGDIFNKTGRYSVNYVGFAPVSATQSLQKFDINTQLPVGAPVVTAISNVATEVNIAFATSGSYRLTVNADGKISNEVAWFTIII